MANLAGRFALVTGGARGIGAAIAQRLHADGARVDQVFSIHVAADDFERMSSDHPVVVALAGPQVEGRLKSLVLSDLL